MGAAPSCPRVRPPAGLLPLGVLMLGVPMLGLLAARPAHAQAPGADAAPGSLRDGLERTLAGATPPPPASGPAWTVTPGLGLAQEWTDNVDDSAIDRRAGLITLVTPSLSVNGSTTRLRADLTYAPTLSVYEQPGTAPLVAQTLGSDALLTLAPETLFVHATGYAAVQSVNAGSAALQTQAPNQQTQLQTYDFSLSPYLTHRFGGWGTAELGVSGSETSAGALGGGASVQQLTSRSEFASFASGENLGRLSSTLSASATQDAGSGALAGAYQNLLTEQLGYALTRGITALASLGWEDLRYGGVGAPIYDDATWSLGVRLLPNPDSSITVTYGHQGGATAAGLDAVYAPSPSLRLFAQYSAGVTTAAQTLQTALSGAAFDAIGRPVDPQSGAPVLLGDNFFGFNATVYQARTLSAGLAWLRPRDAVQLSLQQQTQTPLGGAGSVLLAAGGVVLSQRPAASNGTTGTLSWQHDLSPVLSSTLTGQYGVLGNSTPLTLTDGVLTATGRQVGRSTLVAFSAQLAWQISATLSGQLQYSYTSDAASAGLPGIAANLVLAGLRKSF